MLNIQCFINLMNTIRPDWMQNDEPLRKETERKIRRVMEFSCVDPHAQLSITQVSRSLGYAQMNTDDFMKAEKLAAERYSDISRLSTRKEIVDGKEQDVNIYTEGHRGLLTAVLRDLCLVLSSQESSYSSLPDE